MTTTGSLAEEVVRRCAAEHVTVAAAESLTAGKFCATVADVPGASAVLRGGFVVYATELKELLAGVDPALLVARGPVDPDVAVELARGAARRCQATLGIGLTGVAGPDSQDGKPVGEVYIGVWDQRTNDFLGDGYSVRCEFGDGAHGGGVEQQHQDVRTRIRDAAVERALQLILDQLSNYEPRTLN